MPKLSRRHFLQCTAASSLSMLAGSVTASTPEPSSARLRLKKPSRFRLLQFTDLHFFHGKEPFRAKEDQKTVDLMRDIVDRSDPDLVLLTGDMWHNNPGGRGQEYLHFGVRQMESLGVPWAFTWGNHDELDDAPAAHQTLQNAKRSLYRGAASDGNYLLDITDGKNRPVMEIVCVNSGGEGLAESQWQWLKNLPAPEQAPPRWAAFHIPIRQFEDIWTNGAATGIKGEKECYDNNEIGQSLPVLKSAGIRACLCGHDHINDYAGPFDGIDLIYGRATGYSGYGAASVPKGGKLYEIDCGERKYQWTALLPRGKTWRPKPGERLDYEKSNDLWMLDPSRRPV